MCSASDAAGPALFPLAGFDPTKDESWGARGFEEALSLAREGDEGARHHLTRLLQRNPDSDQARAATAALREYPA